MNIIIILLVTVDGEQRVVCKLALARLHRANCTGYQVLTVCAPIDKRGKHANRPHALPESVLHQIDNHIKSFPTRESHYSRHDNTHKSYLPSDLSFSIMLELYLEKHEPLITAGGNPKPLVSYHTYLTRFNIKFNISFGRPRSDTCVTCDEFNIKLKCADVTQKQTLLLEKNLHLRKAFTLFLKRIPLLPKL